MNDLLGQFSPCAGLGAAQGLDCLYSLKTQTDIIILLYMYA